MQQPASFHKIANKSSVYKWIDFEIEGFLLFISTSNQANYLGELLTDWKHADQYIDNLIV